MLTLAPTAMATLRTFAELESYVEAPGTEGMKLRGFIAFEDRLSVISKTKNLTGGIIDGATTLDGQATTELFSLSDTTLRLEDMALQNGRSETHGGCLSARRSILVFVDVVVSNCAADAEGGAFFLADESFLHASQSLFLANAAKRGGLASLSVLHSFIHSFMQSWKNTPRSFNCNNMAAS